MKFRMMAALVFGLLTLTACRPVVQQPAQQGAQPNQAAAAPADALYIPRDVRFAYPTGTRSADGSPGPKYWQNHSVHTMDITVEPPSRTISATQEITFTNNSPYPMPGVPFKLLQNVRRPDALGVERLFPENFLTSGIHVDELRVNGVEQDWGPAAGQVTMHSVLFPEPLQPGESATFSIRWHFDLGDHVAYTKEGAVDPTSYFLAYFFPRIAVADDVNPKVWDQHEFTYGSLEMYNDFADFDVTVHAPKDFVVWATGDLQNPDEVLQPEYAQRLRDSMTSDEVIKIATPAELQDGKVTAQDDMVSWKWQASNVPDFVVALSDHYNWDAGSVVVDPATGRRASVQAAYDDAAKDFQQMVEYGKSALDFGSTQWPGVPYPYSKTTIFRGVADEEYPMFANDDTNDDPAMTRFVAAHELLHSWFPFYMGINEQRYGFMDEGWTTAFEYLINTRDLGPAGATELFQNFRSKNLVEPFNGVDIPIITPSDALSGNVIGRNNYEKAALGYLALKEMIGDAPFKQALHEFIARWNGKHPIPWDMFNTFNVATGQDLNWFFERWFFEPNYIDLAVAGVEKTDGGYIVKVDNLGGMPIPFDVKVTYADGTEGSFRQNPALWQNSPHAATIALGTDQEITKLVLDGGIFMDANPRNNSWEPAK